MELKKHFQEIINNNWYVQGFNSCLNYVFHGPKSALVGIHDELGFGYVKILFIFDNSYLEFIYDEDDLKRVGEIFLERVSKDDAYLKKILKRDKELVDESKKVIKEVKAIIDEVDVDEAIDDINVNSINIDELSKEQIYSNYKKIWTAYSGVPAVSHVIEGISYVAEPMLKHKIREQTGLLEETKEFRELFTRLLESEKPSFISEEQKELMQILIEINASHSDKLFLKETEEIIALLDKKILRQIQAHAKKYYYNQLNYFTGESMKLNDYIAELKEMIKKNVDPKKFLEDEKNKYSENIKRRKELIKKYGFDEETKKLIELIVMALHWQDDRKKHMLSCVHYQHKYLILIARKWNISHELLKRYSPDELTIEKLDDFDENEVKERMKHFIFYMERKDDKMKCESYTGKDYDLFMKMYKKRDFEKNDIYGMCASTGKVIGKIKVCKTREDLIKVEQGDILVAPMTRPEYMPAMKKASAIITDEGGITCHAAIVSRELKIPCIIGTKIATAVLKDGDVVEVAANHGIVRRIK